MSSGAPLLLGITLVFLLACCQDVLGDCGPQSCGPNGSCVADNCQCNAGFALPFCTEPIKPVELNKVGGTFTIGGTGHKWFSYVNSWTGSAGTNRQTLVFRAQDLTGNCNTLRMYLRPDCGKCTPPEHTFTSDTDTTPTGYQFAQTRPSNGLFSLQVTGAQGRSSTCGCSASDVTSETWYISFNNPVGSTSTDTCTATFMVQDQCGGRGTVVDGLCQCNDGFAGSDCSGTAGTSTVGTAKALSLAGGESAYLSLGDVKSSLGDATVTNIMAFTKKSGSCTGIRMEYRLNCGGCNNIWTAGSVSSVQTTTFKEDNSGTVASTTRTCGCTTSSESTNGFLRVWNTGSTTCSGEAWIGDRCLKRGAYDATARICLCTAGFAGDWCQYAIRKGIVGTKLDDSIPAGTLRYIQLEPEPNVQLNRELRFVFSNRANCSTSIYMYAKYSCDAEQCIPPYPTRCSAACSGQDVSATSLATSAVFSTDRTKCGCSADGAAETWNIVLWNRVNDDTTCEYSLDLTPFCANNGVKVGSSCQCTRFFTGQFCQYPIAERKNGESVVAASSNGQSTTYYWIRPAAEGNDAKLKFELKPPTGSSSCGTLGLYVRASCLVRDKAVNLQQCSPTTSTSRPNFLGRRSLAGVTIEVPATWTPDSNNCDCLSDTRANEFWYIMVTGAETTECRPSLTISVLDPCNNNGIYDSETQTCTCTTGRGGTCEQTILALANTTYGMNARANSYHMLDRTSQPPGFTSLTFTVTPQSSTQALRMLQTNCNDVSLRLYSICDNVCSASDSSIAGETTIGPVPLPQTLSPTFNSGCGCPGSKSPIWYLDVTTGASPCVYAIGYSEQNRCPTKNEDRECSGNGECGAGSTCACRTGFTGIDCSVAISDEGVTEVFNLVPEDRVSESGEAIQFFIPTSKTNTKLIVKVTPKDGSADFKIGVFRRFNEPPVVPVRSVPATFPNIRVTVDLDNVVANETKILSGTQTFEFTELDSGKMYFAIVAVDRVVSFDNIQPFSVTIEVELEDPIGTALDAALLALLLIIFIAIIVYAFKKRKDTEEDEKMNIFERKREENKKRAEREKEREKELEMITVMPSTPAHQEEEAATTIQRIYRGHRKKKEKAAVTIQSKFRKHRKKKGDTDGKPDGSDSDSEETKKRKEEEEERKKKSDNIYIGTGIAEAGRAGVLFMDANQSGGVIQQGTNVYGSGGGGGGGGDDNDAPSAPPPLIKDDGSGGGNEPQTDSEPKKTSTGPAAILAQLIISVCSVVFDVIRVLVNITLIHSSMSTLLTAVAPELEIVTPREDVVEVLRNVVGPFSGIVDGITGAFESVDLTDIFSDGWNCGGTLVIIVPYLLLLLTLLLRVVLKRDLLLILAISIRSFKHGRGAVVKLLITAISKLFTVVLLYAVQVLLVFNHRLISAVFTIKTSCSRVDRMAFQFNRVAAAICLIIMILANFYLFAGRSNLKTGSNRAGRFVAHVLGMIGGVFRILFLTFGYWNNSLVRAHSILYRAEKFDDDDEDDDNQHERVISITGASRGLIWMALPFTIILAKLAEAVNTPPIFIRSDSLVFRRPRWMRFTLWFFHLLQLILVVGLVFFADNMLVFGLAISFLPQFLIDMIDGVQNL